MEDNTTVAELLTQAAKAEKTMGNFYRGLKRNFSEFADISAFWTKMAADENTHVKYMEDIRGSLSPDQLSSNADLDLLHRVRKNLNISADSLLNSVKTFDDAYNLAHEVENSEFNLVFHCIINKLAKSKHVRDFAMASLKDHLDRLMDFGEKFKDKEFRKSIHANFENPTLELSDKR